MVLRIAVYLKEMREKKVEAKTQLEIEEHKKEDISKKRRQTEVGRLLNHDHHNHQPGEKCTEGDNKDRIVIHNHPVFDKTETLGNEITQLESLKVEDLDPDNKKPLIYNAKNEQTEVNKAELDKIMKARKYDIQVFNPEELDLIACAFKS